jgi:hypothetical protein
MRRIILGIVLIFTVIVGKAQIKLVSPIKFPMRLAATFAELRTDHFHMGIDIRTQEVEGKKVYSVADGYISRIKISRSGYGNAIYITHNNGLTSVYGHLQKFRKDIADYVVNRQYKDKKNEIELFFNASQFPLKQDEFFAYSGNSGYSSGPHIHFELRETKTESPINPLHFYASEVPDSTPPYIGKIKIFALDSTSFIQGKNNDIEFTAQKTQGNNYTIKLKDSLRISGNVYFGINTFDPYNNWHNKNGVYYIKLFVNDELIYHHQMDTISYSKNRYVNSLLDYDEYMRLKRKFQKSYLQAGNFLHSIYHNVKNKGVFNFTPNRTYMIRYEVGDIHGNYSTCSFPVKGVAAPAQKSSHQSNGIALAFDQTENITLDSIRIIIPEYALYEDIDFQFSKESPKKGMFSPIYHIHNKFTPLHKSINIRFTIDSLPDKYRSKATVAEITKKGFSALKTKIINNQASFKTRAFGDYTLILDTVAPVIKARNFKNHKRVSNNTILKFTMKDDCSRITNYQASLNGNWILLSYNYRRKEVVCKLDRFLREGKNEFTIQATDQIGNTRIRKYQFVKATQNKQKKSKKGPQKNFQTQEKE